MHLAIGLAAASLAPAAAQPAPDAPVGDWLVQDRNGVIRIEPCGGVFCGTVVGTETVAQCRLTILNVAPAGGGTYSGHITNPDNGSVWNAQISLDGRTRLRLRGYVMVPLLGQTQIWTRYTGHLGTDCRMS